MVIKMNHQKNNCLSIVRTQQSQKHMSIQNAKFNAQALAKLITCYASKVILKVEESSTTKNYGHRRVQLYKTLKWKPLSMAG